MNCEFPKTSELSRREFALDAAKTCLGVSILGGLSSRLGAIPFEGSSKSRQVATARNVIYLYMSGGMTHLDTFGVSPGAETMGPTKAIRTSAPEIMISEHLPTLARFMHHGVVVNSLTSTQGAHAQANYFMHTAYTMRGATRHPSMGAWLTKFQGRSNPALPGSVVITGDSKHPGAGFFEAAIAPLVVNNPAAGLQNSRRPAGLSEGDFDYRMSLSAKLDAGFQGAFKYKNVRNYADVYHDALRVMKSADLVAFDLTKEDESVHDLYGNDSFGQGCLLARRLIEHGVRFVEVSNGGWDTHQDNFTRVPEKCAVLDQAISALLGDLERCGLLGETLVVLTSEFGRTPKINERGGRDHYPKAFSSVFWGGGVRGGQTYGKTDQGVEITENKVTVPDFNATIAYAVGLPLDTVIYSPTKRPFTVADKGQPITGIFG